MASNQNIARLGIVLGLETGEYTTEINQIIQANKKMEREVNSSVKAITREIEELEFATKNYGKTLTKTEQIEQQIQRLRYSEANVGPSLIKKLRDTAAAYDAQAAAAKRAAEADKKAAGGFNQQQMAALGYQTTDIITGLAGGQNPLLVLVQQGGQLRDQFGGVKNVFLAIKEVLTPTKLLLGGVAASIGAVAYAAYKGHEEFVRLKNDLILTNNYAGITKSTFDGLSETIATRLNTTIGDAKDIFGQLVASGKFTQTSMSAVGETIARISKLSGESAETVAKDLIPAFNGTIAAVASLNEKYHFLNLTQYKRIEQLAKEGKSQQVIKETADALNESLGKYDQKLGSIASLWQSIKGFMSEAVNDLMKIGAPTTEADKIKDLLMQLKAAEQLNIKGINQSNVDKLKSDVAKAVAESQKNILAAEAAAAKTAKAAEDVEKYKRAGGLDRSIALEFDERKKLIEDEANLKMLKATELERIEIEGWKRIQVSKLDLERTFREKGYGLADQERKAQAAEEVRILSDVAQKKADVSKKAFDEFNKSQQLRANEVELEREKLQIYEKNLFATETEVALAEKRLKTEQEIAKIKMLEKMPEQQEAAIEREKQILKENEALIQQQERLKALKEVNQVVTSSMADAFEKFMLTGKMSFKEFFKSVLAGLIRIQAQMAAMRAMSGIGSLFSGGGGPVELSGETTYIGPQFANGGSPPVGVPSLVGERGPELFIPRTAGTIIPNEKLSSFGMNQQPQVVYNGPYIASMSAIDTQSASQFLAKNKDAVWAANQSANRSMPSSR